MTIDEVKKLFEKQHIPFEDNAYAFPEEIDASFLFQTGSEVLMISRVRKLNLEAGFFTFETHKRERFFITNDTKLIGIKFSEVELDRLRGAGFSPR